MFTDQVSVQGHGRFGSRPTVRLTAFAAIVAMLAICCFAMMSESDNSEAALETSGTCGDNLTWSVDSKGTLTITGSGPMYNCSNVYPKWGSHNIRTIVIGDSVTSIGDNAFWECKLVTSVSIPNSVTSIGSSAFRHCTSLTSITIPDSVTHISGEAFSDCTRLTTVSLPNNITEIRGYLFENCSSLTNVTIPDSVTFIGQSAFSYCTSLTTINIPDSVNYIDVFAFNYCKSLTSISIPDSVTVLRDDLFQHCESLTSFTIPDSVTIIDPSAFIHCKSLTSISIPGSVSEIKNNVFRGCTSLTSIDVDGSNAAFVSDDGVLFNKTKTKLIHYPANKTGSTYTVPDTVESIEPWAFYGCAHLTSVTVPHTVTSIGTYSFYGCTALTEINVDGSNTAYCSEDGILFNKAKTMLILYPAGKTGSSYTAPDTLETIEADAFQNCASLTSISLPNSVNSITDNAFSGCTALTEINVDGSNTVYCSEDGILFNKAKTMLILYPAGKTDASYILSGTVTSIKNYAFSGCTALTEINVDGSNTAYCSEDGILFNKAKTKLVLYPAGKTDTSYVVPDSITSIESYAFNHTDYLKTVEFVNSSTLYIKSNAFTNCTSLNQFCLKSWYGVGFERNSLVYTDNSVHTINVLAKEGFAILPTSLDGNVDIIYPENPSDSNNGSPTNDGNMPSLFIIFGILAIVVLAGVAFIVKKKHS